MQDGDVVLFLLFPADQDSAKAILPTVRAFDDPTARFSVASLLREFFFAACANMCGVSAAVRHISYNAVIVPFV